MTIRNVFIAACLMIALPGCANTLYKGQRYTVDGLVEAVEKDREKLIASVKPLPSPLTERKLIVAVPAFDFYVNQKVNRFVEEGFNFNYFIVSNSWKTLVPYGEISNMHRFVKSKNMYHLIEQISVEGPLNVAPSDDADILYFATTSHIGQSDQWYHISKRNGQNLIAFDGGSVTDEERLESFLDAKKYANMQ